MTDTPAPEPPAQGITLTVQDLLDAWEALQANDLMQRERTA